VVVSVRESTVEGDVCDIAGENGWRHYKFVSPGRRGVLDHLFTKAVRQVVFIEFKKPGETSSTQQLKRQRELREQGFQVYECDSVEVGRAIFGPI
jgi:hypothetical protein